MPQFIKTETGEELVVLSRRDYDAMRARLGDEAAEDRMAERLIDSALAAGGASLPLEVWDEIEASPSPIGPLRKFRGLTQDALAAQAGISQAYLSEIEAGKKTGDIVTLRTLAKALGVSLEDVLTERVSAPAPRERARSARRTVKGKPRSPSPAKARKPRRAKRRAAKKRA